MRATINRSRQELMGIATIGIILTHSTSMISYDGLIYQIVTWGGYGVYIFMLLSGIGLNYSLQHSADVKGFYAKRFRRVVFPYLLIAGMWFCIQSIGINKSVMEFFYRLLTLSYWFEKKDAWYVAVLIPVYLLYPWYFKWHEKGSRLLKSIIAIIVVLAIEIAVIQTNKDLFYPYRQVFNVLWVFLVGDCIAIYIDKNEKDFWLIVLLSFVLSYCVEKLLLSNSIVAFGTIINTIKALLFCGGACIIVYVLNKMNVKFILEIFRFFGKISLESYLTNIFLIQAISEINKRYPVLANYNVIEYLIVVVMGVVLSVLFRNICNKIWC